jgi:membrane protease YdiL (CAAX protease family)
MPAATAPGDQPGVQPGVGLRWLPWGAAFAFGGLLAGTLLASVLSIAASSAFGSGSAAVELFSFVGLWIGFFGAAVALVMANGHGMRGLRDDIGLQLRFPADLIGCVVGVGCQLILVPGVIRLFQLFGGVHTEEQAKSIIGNAHGASLKLILLAVAVGAPVFEEIFFRGLLLRGSMRRLGVVGAVVVSSVLFGLAHAGSYGGLTLAALITALTLVGVTFALLAVRTGRLGAGLVAHVTFNAITAVAYLLSH